MYRFDAETPNNRRDVARAEKSLARFLADLRALLPARGQAIYSPTVWRTPSSNSVPSSVVG